jgi:ribosomal protein S27AE
MLTLRRTPLEMVRVDAECPKCNAGTLVATKEVEVQTGLYLKEKKFEHTCSACGVGVLLDTAYPQNVLQPVAAPAPCCPAPSVAPSTAPAPIPGPRKAAAKAAPARKRSARRTASTAK